MHETKTYANYYADLRHAATMHPTPQVRVILGHMIDNTKRELTDFTPEMRQEFYLSHVNLDSLPAYVATMTQHAEIVANSGSVFTAEHQAEALRVATATAKN